MGQVIHHIANRFIITVLCAVVAAGAYKGRCATVSSPADISRTLQRQLAQAKSSSDSLLIMENIYDLALQFRPDRADSLAEKIYTVAMRAGNYPVALDMLRQRTNLNQRDDSVIREMRSRARSIPKSDDRTRTLTFINIMLNSYNSRTLDEEHRRERFNDELKRYMVNPPKSIYDKIVLLHSVCVNLSKESHGNLLVSYIGKLEDLIDSVPDPNFLLHNTFYVQSAIDYTESGHPAKAIENDRKLLANIDSLEQYYTTKGRPYRYFDSNRYIIYTRMLSNWADLTPDKIEQYYKKAISIRDKDIRAANSYKNSPRPDIYYAMAHRDYATAQRLLTECMERPVNKRYRRRFLNYLLECARALGDDDVALKASDEYIAILENDLAQRVQERYKELQIIYDVNEIRSQNETLVSERQEARFRAQKIMIIIMMSAAIILLLFAVLLVRQYRKTRRLAESLTRTNSALRKERDNLQLSQAQLTAARDKAEKASNFKSDFIKNLSREVAIPLKAVSEYSHLIVDCTDSTGKPYLERYAELIDQNCALVNSIAADVLRLAEIDSESLTLQYSEIDLYNALSTTIDTVKPRVPHNITLVLDENSPKAEINTDPRRLQQIMISLIANGAKFTPEGSVVVSYDLTPDGNGVLISVADTGIGVPAEKAEYIFERFAKLDKETQGVGLGLTISRLLARLMGGDLTLDTTYSGGARFVLRLPLRPAASHS